MRAATALPAAAPPASPGEVDHRASGHPALAARPPAGAGSTGRRFGRSGDAPALSARRRRTLRARGRRPLVLDHLAGWRDGRRGLPRTAGDDSGGLVPTGHLWTVAAAGHDRLERRYQDLVAATWADRIAYLSAGPGQSALRLRLDEYGDRLALALSQGPMLERRLGEAALPASQIALRRTTEHDHTLRSLRKEITETRHALAAIETEQLSRRARIGSELQGALADARVIEADAQRRIAAYVKGATRSHPDPHSVFAAAADALTGPAPAWLGLTGPEDLIRLTTAEESHA